MLSVLLVWHKRDMFELSLHAFFVVAETHAESAGLTNFSLVIHSVFCVTLNDDKMQMFKVS